MKPMSDYLAMYDKHVAFLCLDPDHYLAEVEWKHAGGPNPNKASWSGSDDGSDEDEDEEESALDAPALLNYLRSTKTTEDIFKAFPSVIHTGLFDINCDKLRDERR